METYDDKFYDKKLRPPGDDYYDYYNWYEYWYHYYLIHPNLRNSKTLVPKTKVSHHTSPP